LARRPRAGGAALSSKPVHDCADLQGGEPSLWKTSRRLIHIDGGRFFLTASNISEFDLKLTFAASMLSLIYTMGTSAADKSEGRPCAHASNSIRPERISVVL
jgi:hypothetical protein